MDGFWEERLQPWDTRAGALLVQEAGGRVSGLDGGPWQSGGGHLLASNGHLHDAMLPDRAALPRASPKQDV